MHLDAVHLYSLTNQERSRLLEMLADRCCDVFSLPGACRQCTEETPLHVEYLQRFAWTEHFLSACSEIAQRYRRRIPRRILLARIRFTKGWSGSSTTTLKVTEPSQPEAFMKELNAYPDQHKAELLRYMLNPVYHEPGKD